VVNTLKIVDIVENFGIGKVVDQFDCEIHCGKEFGKCKYFRRVSGACICIRQGTKIDKRLL